MTKIIKNVKLLFILFFSTTVSGCSSALFNSKGQIGIEESSIIKVVLFLMSIIIIPVIMMTIFFSWKYRASTKNDKTAYQPNWSHSKKIEVFIWMIPIFIISLLAFMSWRSSHSLEPSRPILANEKTIRIQVIAMDWKWFFIYPKEEVASINEIALPVHVPVEFIVTSNSVMNSFFIPRLGSQIYAMHGMKNRLNLIANHVGNYRGLSSNYSGLGFSGMKFKVIVMKDYFSFNQWLKKIKKSKNTVPNMATYKKIALPSEFNKVAYFSKVRSNLFEKVIQQFEDS